jgi:hypothetical protein
MINVEQHGLVRTKEIRLFTPESTGLRDDHLPVQNGSRERAPIQGLILVAVVCRVVEGRDKNAIGIQFRYTSRQVLGHFRDMPEIPKEGSTDEDREEPAVAIVSDLALNDPDNRAARPRRTNDNDRRGARAVSTGGGGCRSSEEGRSVPLCPQDSPNTVARPCVRLVDPRGESALWFISTTRNRGALLLFVGPEQSGTGKLLAKVPPDENMTLPLWGCGRYRLSAAHSPGQSDAQWVEFVKMALNYSVRSDAILAHPRVDGGTRRRSRKWLTRVNVSRLRVRGASTRSFFSFVSAIVGSINGWATFSPFPWGRKWSRIRAIRRVASIAEDPRLRQ